jgi:hypothetical protein
VAGDAATLTFTQQPTDAASGATITPAVTVTAQDAFGNPASTTVHLDLNVPGLADGTLGGDVDVETVGGVATFSDLSVTQTANVLNLPYTLSASASGATSETSDSFDIN